MHRTFLSGQRAVFERLDLAKRRLPSLTVAFRMEATGGRCVTCAPDSELSNRAPVMCYVATVSNLVAGAGVTVKTLATRLRVRE